MMVAAVASHTSLNGPWPAAVKVREASVGCAMYLLSYFLISVPEAFFFFFFT